MIYEGCFNVIVDVFGLIFKLGNVVLLCGSLLVVKFNEVLVVVLCIVLVGLELLVDVV